MINEQVLVHIGYPKTGTTWLQHNLFLPEHGFEPLGSDAKFYGWDFIYGHDKNSSPFDFDANQTISEIQNSIKATDKFPVISNEDLCGHPLSGGIAGRDIANKLAEVFQNPLILITIREQSEIIRSLYEHYMRTGGVCSINAFLETSNESQIPFFNPAVFEYDKLIQYYQAKFGENNVLVLPCEMLKKDPLLYMDAILNFTNVSAKKESVNISPSKKTDFRVTYTAISLRRFNHFFLPYRNHNMRTGKGEIQRTKRWWRILSYFIPYAVKKYNYNHIKGTLGSFAKSYYAESNTRTNNLKGVNLSGYDYSL